MGEVAGDEDGHLPVRRLGEPDRFDGRQLELLEVPEDVEFPPGDGEGLFLQGEEGAIDDEEANEVPRGPDGQDPEGEPVGGPLGEGALPGQLEEARRRPPEAEVREARSGGGPARPLCRQSRFRK
ncbi:MAG TPA: hypothetical protein VNO86_05510 [Candidatus Binatia bacterium]|nr:hypothetical protein [Candidatus Binatia bacterium]